MDTCQNGIDLAQVSQGRGEASPRLRAPPGGSPRHEHRGIMSYRGSVIGVLAPRAELELTVVPGQLRRLDVGLVESPVALLTAHRGFVQSATYPSSMAFLTVSSMDAVPSRSRQFLRWT